MKEQIANLLRVVEEEGASAALPKVFYDGHWHKPKQIVCLGKVAEKWAKKNGWEFVSFPHPQYWKRFKSKEPYPLIEFLRRSTGEL